MLTFLYFYCRKYLTRNTHVNGGNVIRPMGLKRLKNGQSSSGVKVDGTCCVKIYSRKSYRGRSQKLQVTHDDNINFSHIRSMKFGVCSWIWKIKILLLPLKLCLIVIFSLTFKWFYACHNKSTRPFIFTVVHICNIMNDS